MADSSLFTFILEYRGGTYIEQVRAKTVEAALLLWAKALPTDEIFQFGHKLKQKLIDGLQNDEYRLYEPAAISGVDNVWYVSVPLPGGSAGTHLNVVKTVPHEAGRSAPIG